VGFSDGIFKLVQFITLATIQIHTLFMPLSEPLFAEKLNNCFVEKI